MAARESHKLEIAGSGPAPAPIAPAGAILGPLGRLRGQGTVIAPSSNAGIDSGAYAADE